MMGRMLHRAFALYFAIALFCAPLLALAKGEDEETAKLEARLEGYPIGVRLDKGGTALTWLMFIFLGVLGVGVLLKNARRTHLD